MKSALFVDFDNVFSQLRQLQPETAERFARHPGEWIAWLVDALPLPEPPAESKKRRLLVRRCYLNPNWYQTYRHAFLRAGFEIVDCPPVTSQGKTSTDIHMVLDIVELLQHETRYDEFIVFSADADFTPVLRKLRRYDRRTTVLAIGFPSAAYQASADLLIDERLFVQDALGFGRGVAVEPVNPAGPIGSPSVMPVPVPVPVPVSASVSSSPLPSAEAVVSTAATEAGAGAATDRPARQATADELAAVARRIWLLVEESPQPVSAGLMAARLKQEHPQLPDNWNGCGSFKAFFHSLGLSRLVWLSGSGGRVADPSRHDAEGVSPATESDSPWAGAESMFAVVQQVCTLTGAPMLAPDEMKRVVHALAQDLAQHPFDLSATARRVCAECLRSAGLRVRLRDASFLIRGMQLNGHVFGQGHDDEQTLAARLVAQVLFLCEREQLVLDDAAAAHIRHWIGAETPPRDAG